MATKPYFVGCLLLSFPGLLYAQGQGISQVLSHFPTQCRDTASLSYRSITLQSPQGQGQIFISGELRRRPRKDSKTIPGGCFPSKAETPRVTLHLVSPQGYEQSIPLYRHRSTLQFNYVQPVSFSPDGRYLVLQIQASKGVDLESQLEVIDTHKAFLPLYVDFCPGAAFGETLQGFTDNRRAVFKCLSGTDNDREEWNLGRQVGKKIPTEPTSVQQYGTLTQPLQILR